MEKLQLEWHRDFLPGCSLAVCVIETGADITTTHASCRHSPNPGDSGPGSAEALRCWACGREFLPTSIGLELHSSASCHQAPGTMLCVLMCDHKLHVDLSNKAVMQHQRAADNHFSFTMCYAIKIVRHSTLAPAPPKVRHW